MVFDAIEMVNGRIEIDLWDYSDFGFPGKALPVRQARRPRQAEIAPEEGGRCCQDGGPLRGLAEIGSVPRDSVVDAGYDQAEQKRERM